MSMYMMSTIHSLTQVPSRNQTLWASCLPAVTLVLTTQVLDGRGVSCPMACYRAIKALNLPLSEGIKCILEACSTWHGVIEKVVDSLEGTPGLGDRSRPLLRGQTKLDPGLHHTHIWGSGASARTLGQKEAWPEWRAA